jgi:hypothetical protein
MATRVSENGDLPSPSESSVFSPSVTSPSPLFSPSGIVKGNVQGIRTFSFENGGNEAMNKEELKHVEAIVYERYIRDLKGIKYL